jgi:hypothetical protein
MTLGLNDFEAGKSIYSGHCKDWALVPRMLLFCCTVNRSLFGDAIIDGWEPVPGTTTPKHWMCTEYRLSVTPEKIVVQDKINRGHFLQQCAMGAQICSTSLQLCRIAT